jgi:enoyl-CoA hydratase/carnithine racemase
MQSLVELMPARKVLDWCMRAQTLSTNEALSYGLVTHIAPNEEDLDAQIAALAADICQYSPSAIRMGLTAFDELRNIPAAEQHQYLSNMLMQTLQTEDAMEGIMAFQQKRDPQWKGK